MRRRKHELPKYIYLMYNKYQVRIPDGCGTQVTIGTYNELVDAVIQRDDTITAVGRGELDLSTYSANKYPKGITSTRHDTFRARIDVNGKQMGIGTYKTIEKAVEARKEFILNLL